MKKNNIVRKAAKINRIAWNHWARLHPATKFYDMEKFRKIKSSLNPEETALLGDIKGKKLLHLQCHFGQDTLSLAQLGAEVTGVDISEVAIETARNLSKELNLKADFVQSDILKLNLGKKFDVIFTSYGVLTWLGDLEKWGKVLAEHLEPAGKFIIIEFHPLISTTTDDLCGFSSERPYSSKGNPIIFDDSTSYADSEDKEQHTTYEFNHSLADVLQALRKANFDEIDLKEYDYSNYACYTGLTETIPGSNQYKHPVYTGPLMFSVKATFNPQYKLELQIDKLKEEVQKLLKENHKLRQQSTNISSTAESRISPRIFI